MTLVQRGILNFNVGRFKYAALILKYKSCLIGLKLLSVRSAAEFVCFTFLCFSLSIYFLGFYSSAEPFSFGLLIDVPGEYILASRIYRKFSVRSFPFPPSIYDRMMTVYLMMLYVCYVLLHHHHYQPFICPYEEAKVSSRRGKVQALRQDGPSRDW